MDTEKDRVNKSLRFSFLDGAFASGMVGFTQEYFAPFVLLLGATARHIGMLSAFPSFFASLTQLKSADIAEKFKSRKKVISIFVFLQALMLVPMAVIALSGTARPSLFIAVVILFVSLGALASPVWSSLMSDFIEEGKRGEYFGWRNRVLGSIVVTATFIAGLILHMMKKINVFRGFAIVFFLAFIFRTISWFYLKLMHEPKLEYKKEHYFTFFDFIRGMRKRNFAKFVLFVSLMNFSVNIASPFFTVLMLKDLHFSYLLYTLITITATITIYIMIERWGRHADSVGNMKIIRFTAPLLGVVPFLWILNQSPAFLVLAQIFSGFAWAGFNISTANFIYDAVTPGKRTRCLAYFNVLNGLALCGGALLGGFMLQWLPAIFKYRILTLFLISSVLRLMVGIFMPPRLKEVRPVKKVKTAWLFFSIIGIRPILGIERKTIRY